MPNHGTLQQNRARRTLNAAVKAGHVTRPDKCEKCGALNKPCADGRARIHAHHHRGYGRPLDVEWLCSRCHALSDVKNHGEEHPKAVLKERDVRRIMKLRASGHGLKRVAKMLNLKESTTRSLWRGETWAWLTGIPRRNSPPKKRVRSSRKEPSS